MVENKIIAFTGHTNIEKCTGRTLVKMGEVYDKTSYDMIYNDIQLFMEKLANKKIVLLPFVQFESFVFLIRSFAKPQTVSGNSPTRKRSCF